jgi:hypothetical protein
MVELVEVEDESFESKQMGPSSDDEYSDTGIAPSLTLALPNLI